MGCSCTLRHDFVLRNAHKATACIRAHNMIPIPISCFSRYVRKSGAERQIVVGSYMSVKPRSAFKLFYTITLRTRKILRWYCTHQLSKLTSSIKLTLLSLALQQIRFSKSFTMVLDQKILPIESSKWFRYNPIVTEVIFG